MNIVDVDNLEMQEMKKNVISQVVKKDMSKLPPPPPKLYGIKHSKQKMRMPPIPKEPKIKIDKDFINSIDSIIYSCLSLPMKDNEKKEYFKKKLKENKFIDKYIKDKVYMNYLGYLNDDLKFGLVYGTTYYDVYKTDLLTLEEKDKQKPKPKPKLEIEVDNISLEDEAI